MKEFAGLSPSFRLELVSRTIETAGEGHRTERACPRVFQGTWRLCISATPIDELKTYMTWGYLRISAPALSSKFVNENFDFYGRMLAGQKEMQPRWKRCITAVDSDLGEALGKKYVELTFGKEAKDRMTEMVRNLETALEKGPSATRLDDARNEEARTREIARNIEQDRLSGKVA